MKSFFERRDRWGNSFALWLLGATAFLLPLVMFSLSQIRMHNDVIGWLPQDDEQSQVLAWYQNLFPDEDRVLVSWDGCSLTDPRLQDFSRRLEGAKSGDLREGGSVYVQEVTEPTDLIRRMPEEKIPFKTALERTQGLLTGKGPVCLALADFARPHSLSVAEAATALGAEKFGITVTALQCRLPEPSSRFLERDDEKAWELHDALTEFVASQRPADLQLQWDGMHVDAEKTAAFLKAVTELRVSGLQDEPTITDSWFVTGATAAASVSLSAAGLEDPVAALEAIRRAAAESGIPESDLHMGGRTVAATALNTAVRRAAWNDQAAVWMFWLKSPLALAAVTGMVCSWLTLRSLRLCLLVQGVSLLSSAAACALIVPFGGSMNMVLAVMPTLLLVITVSGAIHLCNYWKNSGISCPEQSVTHAVSRAWTPCLLAGATTAIGLASLMVSDLVPVREFGLFASLGCLISMACILYVLPALMLQWPAVPPKPREQSASRWYLAGIFLVRRSGFNLTFNLLLTMAAVSGLVWFRTETKAIRYFSNDSRVMQDYVFLEQKLAGIVPVDAIVRFNATQQKLMPFEDRIQAVMKLQQALVDHPEITGALSLASFLAAESPGSGQVSRTARLRENLTEQKIREALQDPASSKTSVASLIALPNSTIELPGPEGRTLQKAGDEIWRITCQASILSDVDYRTLTDELTKITEKALANLPGGRPESIVTGLVPVFLRTQDALLESLINSFAVAFLLIGVVMAVLLKDITAAMLAMLPNVMPVALVFGLLGWLGIRVDVGTMITASVALGIAVDGTLHLISCFQQQLKSGVARDVAVARAMEHCGPALWQTSIAVGVGMLTLFPVELLLISRFGWIMCALIVAALWGDAVLLPSLLAGTLGNLLERKIQVSRPATVAEQHSIQTESLVAATVDATVPISVLDADEKSTVPLAGPHYRHLRLGTPGSRPGIRE
ncbi:MAG: hypothetical protein RLZZ232_77 [Planctomycetota bacterium]|jgi:predicted RND superfamily exporter protein